MHRSDRCLNVLAWQQMFVAFVNAHFSDGLIDWYLAFKGLME